MVSHGAFNMVKREVGERRKIKGIRQVKDGDYEMMSALLVSRDIRQMLDAQ